MIKFLTAAAILSVIVSPALAKNNQAQRSYASSQAQQSYAQAPRKYDRGAVERHSSNPAYDVYVNGQYIGSDPDPFIRGRLADESYYYY